MKLITISVVALFSIMLAQADPNEKKSPTIDNVNQRIAKLRDSVDKTKESLAKAAETQEEKLAQFDASIAAAKAVLTELADNGPVAQAIDTAAKANEEKIQKLEQAARDNPKLESALTKARLELREALDDIYAKKTEMVKKQFDVKKKLESFERNKEAFALLSSVGELKEANAQLADVISGITALGSSLDDFGAEKADDTEDAKPSKN